MIVTEFERRTLREKRKILVAGEICEGDAHEFLEDMNILLSEDSNEPIRLIIASIGGEAFPGFAMIRAIRAAQRRGIRVIGEVNGCACSMAFFMLQSCDERRMGTLDVLMAHGVTTGLIGDMKNIEAETKLLNHWHTEWSRIVAGRCKGDYNEAGYWFEVFRDNTPCWYTADEALEMGLVDTVDDAN